MRDSRVTPRILVTANTVNTSSITNAIISTAPCCFWALKFFMASHSLLLVHRLQLGKSVSYLELPIESSPQHLLSPTIYHRYSNHCRADYCGSQLALNSAQRARDHPQLPSVVHP